MKKINKYIAILIASLLSTSCSDFLDVKSESAMDDGVIFSTVELAESAVMGITVSFAETKSYRGRFLPYYGSNSDIEYFNASDANNSAKADLATYNVKPINSEMNEDVNAWAKMYEGVERANLAIRGITNSGKADPQTPLGHLLAEALTLRAVLYLDLTRAWGDVPARFQPLVTSTINIAKADRDVIYKQLIADLEQAAFLAYWPNEHKFTSKSNRINKAFIKALRAKICMVAAGYGQRPDSDKPRLSTDPELTKALLYPIAESELLALYNNQEKAGKLEATFEGIFKLLCEEDLTSGRESLWQIPFSSGRGRMAYTFAIKHRVADQYTEMNKGGDVGPTPNFFYDYDVNDLRRDITCIPYTWSESNPAVQTFDPKHDKLNNWNFGKYRFEWMKRRVTSANDDGLNKQYMRFAEVILMLAEVKNELEGPAAAAPYLKELRARAFESSKHAAKVEAYVNASNTKEKMFDAIVDEHAFEFAGEMIRKEALIRWNLLGSKMKETKEKLYELRVPTGRYADVPTILYTKNVEAFPGDRNKEKLEIYGLNRGEFDDMSATHTAKEWIKESELKDEKIESLYKNDPDQNQFWPIWQIFIDGSNGMLTNDYGY